MNRILKTFPSGGLLLIISLFAVDAHSQNSVTVSHPPNAVTILDSTKAQDGLTGSVRRVKTESARLELKSGRVVESPRQLVEVTTYDVAGKRIENFTYPVASASVGKEEYEYDAKGNIVAMTMRAENGSILSKETYTYEFDRFGNWTKMVTNLVVFESGELKREPVEVTYRSLTYYFDDSVAKMVESPAARKAALVPESNSANLNLERRETAPSSQLPTPIQVTVGDAPALNSPAKAANTVSQPPPEKSDVAKVTRPDSSNTRTGRQEKPVASPEAAMGERVASSPASKLASRERKVESPPAKTTESTAKNITESAAKNTTESSWYRLFKSGRDLFDMGDVKGAIDAYLASIAIEPNSAEVYLYLGHAYIKLDKNRDAAKAFKQCVRLKSELVEAQYGLGLAEFRIRRFEDAVDAFKKAVALEPKHARAHYGLGMSYKELKQEKGLMDEYRILQTLDAGLAKELAKPIEVLNLPCRNQMFCR
jgi:tetratricopeptide (TPR) repeat protein